MDGTTVFCGSARTGGTSCRASAAKFEVSSSFVIKLMQRWRQHGTVQPERVGDRKRAKLAVHAERVSALMAAAPDLTSAERVAGWRPRALR